MSKWIPRSEHSLKYYEIWEASGYVTLPFPGAVVDQPDWIMDDFWRFIELSTYNDLIIEREQLLSRLARLEK